MAVRLVCLTLNPGFMGLSLTAALKNKYYDYLFNIIIVIFYFVFIFV